MIETKNNSDLSIRRNNLKNSEISKLLTKLFDKGEFTELNLLLDLHGDETGLICAYGLANGRGVYAFAQNSKVNGGAICKSNVTKIKKLYSLALKTGLPIVGVYDSCGGDLKEGNDLLNEYNDLIYQCNRISGVVPQISVIIGSCFGMSAIMASSGDIIIMSGTARCGLDIAGQNSDIEFCKKFGISHIAGGSDVQAIEKARKLLSVFPSNNISHLPILDYIEPKNARNYDLFTADGALNFLVDDDSLIELQKEFGKHFRVGFSTVKGNVAGIVISDFKETNIIDSDSCTKISRFIRLCDSYSIPVITLVNANKFDSLKESSRVCSVYSESTCVKITVVTGNACGAINIAFCGQNSIDVVLAWPSAVISPLQPETAVEVLWHDKLKGSGNNTGEVRRQLENEYKNKRASGILAAESGLIDEVILPSETRNKVAAYISMMLSKREIRLPKKHSNMHI